VGSHKSTEADWMKEIIDNVIYIHRRQGESRRHGKHQGYHYHTYAFSCWFTQINRS